MALADALVPTVACFRPHWRAMTRGVLEVLRADDKLMHERDTRKAALAEQLRQAQPPLPPLYCAALELVAEDLALLKPCLRLRE